MAVQRFPLDVLESRDLKSYSTSQSSTSKTHQEETPDSASDEIWGSIHHPPFGGINMQSRRQLVTAAELFLSSIFYSAIADRSLVLPF